MQCLLIAPIRYLNIGANEIKCAQICITSKINDVIEKFDLDIDSKIQEFTQNIPQKGSEGFTFKVVGPLFYADLLSSQLCAYQILELNESDSEEDAHHKLNGEAAKFSAKIEGMFDYLWFVKDNSVTSHISFAICFDLNKKYGPTFSIGHYQKSNCLNNYDSIDLDKTTYQIWNGFISKLSPLLNIEGVLIEAKSKDGHTVSNYDGDNYFYKGNRLLRAFDYIKNSRKPSPVIVKISFYIGALECLFTSDNTEVTHKVAERCAFFVTEAPNDRHDVYSIVKKAYNIRSKYFHGQSFDAKDLPYEKIEEISTKISNVVRLVFNKIVMMKNNPFLSGDINAFYKTLIFGDK